MKFVVLGGYGMMGKVVLQDLYTTAPSATIIIVGHDPEKVRTAVRQYHSERVKGTVADASSIPSMVKTFRGAEVVINCVQYELNLKVMEACLTAKAHYLDLGGLFHMTRKQLKLHRRFKKAGLLAIVGMGAAPGITNLLARYGADQLDMVSSVKIRVGSADFTRMHETPPLVISYSIQTILEEHTKQPMVFSKGTFKAVPPLSGKEVVVFPKPVGKQIAIRTLHSEVATLPHSLKAKGIKDCDFKIAFDPYFEEVLGTLIDLGFASTKPIMLHGQRMVPFEEMVNVLSQFQRPIGVCPTDQEILRVVVKGKKNGKRKTLTLDCHARSIKNWCMSAGDVDTGVPPSIVAQMIVSGAIGERGVLPPEQCVPLKLFFQELRKRKMQVLVNGNRFSP